MQKRQRVKLRSKQTYPTKGIFTYREVKTSISTFTLLLAKLEAYRKCYSIQTTNSIQNNFQGSQKKELYILLLCPVTPYGF